MGKLTRISNQSELDNLLAKNELVMIKFTASWCGPCKAIAPVVDKMQSQFPGIKFIEIDVDESQAISRKYGITAMPTFVFLHNNKEINRVQGADVGNIMKSLTDLQSKNPFAKQSGSSSEGSSSKSSSLPQVIADKIPKGFDILNDNIFFGESELLNVSGANTDVIKGLTDINKSDTAIYSDADSQLMVYLPFQNKVKLHTIFIKSCKSAVKSQDEDELQQVSQIKVWPNTLGPISFEDATGGSIKPMHDEQISEKLLDDGWTQITLRYVHFQNVTSVLIFLDGDDEDKYTVLEKVVLIGTKGDSRDQGKLEKQEME